MDLLVAVLLLVVGFVMLIKGADWFVGGSSDVAKLLKIPTMIVGLTIVSCAQRAVAPDNRRNNRYILRNEVYFILFSFFIFCYLLTGQTVSALTLLILIDSLIEFLFGEIGP